jgi:hypothetical protein
MSAKRLSENETLVLIRAATQEEVVWFMPLEMARWAGLRAKNENSLRSMAGRIARQLAAKGYFEANRGTKFYHITKEGRAKARELMAEISELPGLRGA